MNQNQENPFRKFGTLRLLPALVKRLYGSTLPPAPCHHQDTSDGMSKLSKRKTLLRRKTIIMQQSRMNDDFVKNSRMPYTDAEVFSVRRTGFFF